MGAASCLLISSISLRISFDVGPALREEEVSGVVEWRNMKNITSKVHALIYYGGTKKGMDESGKGKERYKEPNGAKNGIRDAGSTTDLKY